MLVLDQRLSRALGALAAGAARCADGGADRRRRPAARRRLRAGGAGARAAPRDAAARACTRRSARARTPWRSPSTAGIDGRLRAAAAARRAQPHVRRLRPRSRRDRESRHPVRGGRRTSRALTPSAWRCRSRPYEQQLWQFRRQLLGWFSGLLLALLVTLAALLRWVLAPLRRMEREIHAVEEGRSETLGAGYPRELAGVAGNLNALLHRGAQARRRATATRSAISPTA